MKRFSMVGKLSSAARMPLPGASNARMVDSSEEAKVELVEGVIRAALVARGAPRCLGRLPEGHDGLGFLLKTDSGMLLDTLVANLHGVLIESVSSFQLRKRVCQDERVATVEMRKIYMLRRNAAAIQML